MRAKVPEFYVSEHPELERLTPILRSYLHARVTIYYSGGQYQDTGHITYFDGTWVELTKVNGERILTPQSGIRIIKMLEPSAIESDAMMLLRPAEPDSIAKKIT